MKKIISIVILTITLTLTICGISSYADFGTGVSVIANEVQLIKTGIYGRKLTFSDTDFKQGLCITDFKSITITKIPSSTEGTLMLAGRRVGEGSTIKRKNIAALVFIPATNEVEKANFKFTVDGFSDGVELDFLIRFTDKVNYEPEIGEEYTQSLSQKTQREIGIHGNLLATDKEGDKIEYMIVSYPKDGTLKLTDKESGDYVYTPNEDFIGEDSFCYVARDEWGNYSKLCRVTVEVGERMCETVYTDMEDRSEYNAAVAVTATGIMSGKIVGDGLYFAPDEIVTRAEFVAMAMKATGIKADSTIGTTYFDDDYAIPTALSGYIATAQRIGIIQGKFTDGKLLFSPNEAITKYEAGVIMANLLGAKSSGEIPVFSDESSVPTWARASVFAMYSLGIFEYESDRIFLNMRATE